MPACRYVKENSSTATLATKSLVGIAPVVNLRECVTCTPPSIANKAAHSGFETHRTCHQKFKTGVSVTPKKDMYPPKIYKKEVKTQQRLNYTQHMNILLKLMSITRQSNKHKVTKIVQRKCLHTPVQKLHERCHIAMITIKDMTGNRTKTPPR